MDTFSSNRYEKFGDVASFYPSELDSCKGVNVNSLLQRELFDSEFDLYSDVSIDTTSSFSFDSSEYLHWAIQEKKIKNIGTEPLCDSLNHKGRSMWTHSQSLQSSRWSGDEMSELLAFDESIPLSPKIMVDDDEERYLAELVHQDLIAANLGWGYPRAMEGIYLNMEGTLQGIPGDLVLNHTPQCVNSQDNIRLKRESVTYKEKVFNLHEDNNSVQINPNTNQTLPNPNNRKNHSRECSAVYGDSNEGANQNTKSDKESSHNLVSKKKTKKKEVKSTDDDAQRVFLGGLPIGMTERTLRQHLASMGYKVLKRPKILHSFAPEVWMKTIDQAKDLIKKGVIMIDDTKVEVRPYNTFTKLSELKKLPNVGKRSVFIGGLSPGTSTKNLQDTLTDMGMKVINYPVIKHGFARRVIMDTISQAKTLIRMRRVKINGTFADVRQFVIQRRRRNRRS